jgi:hypothetical protein
MFRRDITDEMFFNHLTLFVAKDTEMIKMFKRKFDVEHDSIRRCQGQYGTLDNSVTGETFNYLWIRDNDEKEITPSVVSTLQHELIHCCVHSLANRGIPITGENHETLAYYYTFMFDKTFSKLMELYEKRAKLTSQSESDII